MIDLSRRDGRVVEGGTAVVLLAAVEPGATVRGAAAVGRALPPHAFSDATSTSGTVAMIDRRMRNLPSRERCGLPHIRRARRRGSRASSPFDLYSPRRRSPYAEIREEPGDRRNVIVMVGVLTVLVLAWLLFRAEARRYRGR